MEKYIVVVDDNYGVVVRDRKSGKYSVARTVNPYLFTSKELAEEAADDVMCDAPHLTGYNIKKVNR